MKKLVYITFLLFCTNSMFGQNKLTNAIYSLKNNELDKAKELIDAASEDTLFSKDGVTWYFKGFIYKNLFKRDESQLVESPLREQSISYFRKAVELLEPDNKYADGSKKSLSYLANTLYNQSVGLFTKTDYPRAITNYEKYKALMIEVHPEIDLTEKDIMFNMALATTFGRFAEEDSVKSEKYLDDAKDLYQEVLDLDSNNVSANYNMGIIFYNEGVDIVQNMDYSLDLFELNEVQDRIIELFRESLPFMLKAYELNPRRKETLIGLQGIYFSLNDIAKSDSYKYELEGLEKNGKLENSSRSK